MVRCVCVYTHTHTPYWLESTSKEYPSSLLARKFHLKALFSLDYMPTRRVFAVPHSVVKDI